jgi:excisionase family DNA binding protein
MMLVMLMMSKEPSVVFTPSEVAQVLRVNEETVRREIRRGNLSALRVGNQYRMAPSDLAKWLGDERFLELFTPLEALSGLLGSGGLAEKEATRLAEKAVKDTRTELWSSRAKTGIAPSATDVRKRIAERRKAESKK